MFSTYVDERAQRLPLRADARRRDFARVEPWDGQPADAEEDLEKEDHGRCAVGGGLAAGGEQDRGEREA